MAGTSILCYQLDYLAMMGIYIGGTYYTLKFIQRQDKTRLKRIIRKNQAHEPYIRRMHFFNRLRLT